MESLDKYIRYKLPQQNGMICISFFSTSVKFSVNSENGEAWPSFNIVSDVLAPLTINQFCKVVMAA